MELDDLPSEIITQVFLSLPTLSSVLALSATSHRFNSILRSSKRLPILSSAVETEFGPLHDIVQLLTHNASQPAHIPRSVPISNALVQQIVKVGRVAQRWEEVYPFKKWKTDYANRRLLTANERYTLRRAIYRLWLFTNAFHNSTHVRTCRCLPEVLHDRAALLHNFSTTELAEMLDVQLVLRDVVAHSICPSNSKVRARFQKRHPETHAGGGAQPLLFHIHLNYPPASDAWPHISAHHPSHLQPTRFYDPVPTEGWGDDITHYYIVEDMMKLPPDQLLFLREMCGRNSAGGGSGGKALVTNYLRCHVGEWFANNGETLSETLGFVIRQRGGEIEELKEAVEMGEVGVAIVCGGRSDW